jgi:hypothetical protein
MQIVETAGLVVAWGYGWKLELSENGYKEIFCNIGIEVKVDYSGGYPALCIY